MLKARHDYLADGMKLRVRGKSDNARLQLSGKIMGNGDVIDSYTGKYIDNLYNYEN